MDRKFIAAMASLLAAAGGIGAFADAPWNFIVSIAIFVAVVILSAIRWRRAHPDGSPGRWIRRRSSSGEINWRGIVVKWRRIKNDEFVAWPREETPPALGPAPAGQTEGNGGKEKEGETREGETNP